MKVLGLVEISSRVWKMAHVKKKLEEHIFLYIPTYTVLFFFFCGLIRKKQVRTLML